MKNISKNGKAGVHIIAVVAVIAIIIVAGIFVITGGSTEYWETETEFGMWQEELIIEFEDGTTKSMKIIDEGSGGLLSVYYEGKAISMIYIVLSAKATGSGFEGAYIQCDNFGYDLKYRTGTGGFIRQAGGGGTNNVFTIPLGTTKQIFRQGIGIGDYMDSNLNDFPDGDYILEFIPRGVVRYRGYNPNEASYKTASLPPTRDVFVSVNRTPSGSILVTLYSGIESS